LIDSINSIDSIDAIDSLYSIGFGNLMVDHHIHSFHIGFWACLLQIVADYNCFAEGNGFIARHIDCYLIYCNHFMEKLGKFVARAFY